MEYVDFTGKDIKFELVGSTFKRVLSSDDIAMLINENVAFNGITIRIEGIDVTEDEVKLKISQGEFFDLMSTNLALGKGHKSVEVIEKSVEGMNGLELLGNELLANAGTVSIILESGDYVFLTKRSNKVAVYMNAFGVSVTGSMDGLDLGGTNPIEATARRETLEELSREIEDFEIQGMFIGDTKRQPVFMCRGKIEDITRLWDDFFYENQKLLKVKKEDVLKYIDLGMTEAAQFHLTMNYDKGNN